MDDGNELHLRVPVPMQHLIEPVERTLQSAKLAQEEGYETKREDLLPMGLRRRVLHPTLGDIGWIELHSRPENEAELALLVTWYRAAVSKATLASKRDMTETLLGRVSVLTMRVKLAWKEFSKSFLEMLANRELRPMGVGMVQVAPEQPPAPGDSKRRGGRPKGSGKWRSSHAFLLDLAPVLRELERHGSISQERAAERLAISHAQLKRYLKNLEREQGKTWEQVIHEALNY